MKKSILLSLAVVLASCFVFVITSSCSKDTYRVGSRGPAGGWIFYDKGAESDGWRYLEAAPEDQSESAKSGCPGKAIDNAKNTAVGTGKANTDAIIAACNDPDIAANIAAAYRGGGKDNWFLPSREELVLMQKNLQDKNIGNFDELGYHSSSVVDAQEYWYVLFMNGNASRGKRDYVGGRVRAARAF